MPSGIGKRVVAVFVLAILLLIANAAISFRATNTLIENNNRVVRTQQVIETLGDTLLAVTLAETSQRGYLITGDDAFLEPYNGAGAQIPDYIARLKELSSDSTDQAERLQALEAAIGVRMSSLAKNLEIRQRGGVSALLIEGKMDQGKGEMNEVRRIGAEIQAEEDRLLAERTTQSHQSARNIQLTFLAANALVLTLLGLVYYLVSRDLAERKRASERLQEARDHLEVRVKERTAELADANTELERSNRELQDFAFVASHDLQEPLRKIQAFGDRLHTKHGSQLNDEARDYLERMQGAAGRMYTLINDLLTFSRVTTRAQPFVPTDLNDVTKEVLNDLEVSIQDSRADVEVGDLPTIDADPLQMRQLMQNLIGNALKFHKAEVPPIIKIKGTVSANCPDESDEDDEQLRLIVEDNGIGFDEKYLDRIFTPFQRLHGRNEYEGTGIGLAVCRKIVERHGGILTAKSMPGEGSTFIITLPVNQGKEKPTSEGNGTADNNTDG